MEGEAREQDGPSRRPRARGTGVHVCAWKSEEMTPLDVCCYESQLEAKDKDRKRPIYFRANVAPLLFSFAQRRAQLIIAQYHGLALTLDDSADV